VFHAWHRLRSTHKISEWVVIRMKKQRWRLFDRGAGEHELQCRGEHIVGPEPDMSQHGNMWFISHHDINPSIDVARDGLYLSCAYPGQSTCAQWCGEDQCQINITQEDFMRIWREVITSISREQYPQTCVRWECGKLRCIIKVDRRTDANQVYALVMVGTCLRRQTKLHGRDQQL
jgi:hypothetical protein